MNKNYDLITFILKYFISRRTRVASVVDITKIATIFIKATFRNSNKIKKIRNYVKKNIVYICVSDITKKFFRWKSADVSRG